MTSGLKLDVFWDASNVDKNFENPKTKLFRGSNRIIL